MTKKKATYEELEKRVRELESTEAERKKVDEQFSAIMKSSPVPTAVGGADGSIVLFNQALEQLIGYKRFEIKDVADWANKLYPDSEYRDFVWKNIGQALDGQKQDCTEFTITCKDGSTKVADFKTSFFQGGLIIQLVDITERKRAEESLLMMAEMLDTAPTSITVHDSEGRFLYANRKTFDLHGYEATEFMALNLHNLDVPESEALIAERMQLIKEKGEASFNVNHFRKDGTTIPMEVFVKIVEWQGTSAMLSIATDITERKQAEEKLIESERLIRIQQEFLENIYNNVANPIWVIDVTEDGDFRFADCNAVYKEDSNFTLEEFIGKTPEDLVPLISPDLAKQINANYQRCLEAGDAITYSEDIEIKDKKLNLLTTLSPVKNEEGRIIQIIGLSTNVTELKRAEEALRESEGRLSGFMNSASDSFYLLDSELNFVEVNKPALEIMGKKKEDVIGKNITEIVPDIKESGRYERHMAVIRTGKPYIVDNFVPHPVFGTRHFILKSFKVRSGLGVIASDITERMQLEEERSKAAKLESIGILAGGIAHDFNNILASVLGNISLANIIADEDIRQVKELLTEAEKACRRATDLTKQLLTFSKGGTPVKKITQLKGLLMEASGFALRGSNVRCEYDIQDELWPADVDAGQINQVINNLVINADQAMPEGGAIVIRAKNVTVNLKDQLPLQEGKYVKIDIIDRGIGISAESLSKIFDPYYTTKQKGSGLGLATSYSIIKSHGGHIDLESEIDVGTTFHLYLPASSERVLEKEEAKEEAIVIKGKILVMDDEEALRTTLGRMLRLLGLEVELAENGEETIELYRNAMASEQPFDAVILDLTIRGGMGGKKTIKRLLEIDPEVKAIVSSGYSTDQVLSEFEEHGFRGMVSKPYNLSKLQSALQSILAS
ncbi:PAS domain S-box protein [Gemmatimonadota bacterium]